MNIWIINHYALSPQSAGITRHYDLANKLSGLGHDVSIVAASFNHWSKKDEHCQEGERFSLQKHGDVSFLWLKTPPYAGNLERLFNMLVFSWRVLFGVGCENLQKPDIIIGSSPHLFGARASLSIARKLEVPFILEIRDLWPQTLLDIGNFSRWHPLVKVMGWLEKTLYKKSDHIVSLLPGAATYITKAGSVLGSKITWIPNGVDLGNIPCEKAGGSNGRLKVVYAGSHGVANGLDSIVKAISILEKEWFGGSFQFLFYGEGPEKKSLQQMASDLDIKSLSFQASIPKSNVYKVLQTADVFIVTLKDSDLYKYGMSLNKLYDYLALARPVVFGGNSLNNPVAEAKAGIVVSPEDSQAMADALRRLAFLSVDQRMKMGIRGKEFVAKVHNINDLSLKLETVCLEMIGKQ